MPDALFSLAGEALTKGLTAHVRHVVSRFSPEEFSPRVPNLATRAFRFIADDAELSGIADELRGPCLALGVDCALLTGEMALHGPRLIVSDVDSTFIHGEVIDMLAERAGSLDVVADITARAMAGELDFAQSLEARVATLEGLDAEVLTDIGSRVCPVLGADALVRTAHSHGAKVGLVSGGFHEVVDVLVEKLGIDFALANRLEVTAGHLTGRTRGPVVTREAKANALAAWSGSLSLSPASALAMGDGANDLSMMEIAGLSVAVRAKPVVLEYADVAITRQRLDILIALLGWDAL